MKLSLEQFYGRYHELCDRYDISIPQMAIDCFFSHFTYIVLSSINDSILPNLTMWVTRWASYKNRNYLLFASTCVGDIIVAHLVSFVVLFLLCLSSSCALCTFISNFTFSIIEYHFCPSCTVCEIILDDFVKHYVV